MSDYTVHDYQWLKDMHIDLAQSEIEISPADLHVLAEASDRITITESRFSILERDNDELRRLLVKERARSLELREDVNKVLAENKQMEAEMKLGAWVMAGLFVIALILLTVLVYVVKR